LEGCKVARRLGYSALIVSDKKVHHAPASAARELFCEVFGEGRNARMCDGDRIEWFERLYYPEGCTILFDDTEPARPIRGVRWFKYSGVHFALNNFANFIIYSWRNRHVALSPRLMRDCRDFDWWEEVFSEMAAFRIIPSEAILMNNHEMMEQRSLLVP